MWTYALAFTGRLFKRCVLISLSSLIAVWASLVQAADREDTRRMLEINVERQAAERERDLLKGQSDELEPSLSRGDEQVLQVERTAPALGQALYMALQAHQWKIARQLLNEYLKIADRDPMLEHYASGILARESGDNARAIDEFRELLTLQPDFLPAKLELARSLFMDGQNREADDVFADVLAGIDDGDAKTSGVRKTVMDFRNALAQRQAWSGAFSFGPEWSDNVNRTSASRTCLFGIDGYCFFERTLPKAISSTGVSFDASVQRRISVYRHHGFFIRSQLFGTQYRTQGDYNETTFNAEMGYSFLKARHQFTLAPTFEYYEQGNHAYYGAMGAHAEWSYLLSENSLLKLEGDYKDRRLRQRDYAENLNGEQKSAWATYYYGVSQRVTLFGGVDFTDTSARSEVNGYRQKGIRIGASADLPAGFQATLFSSLRQRDYDIFNPLLDERRRDREQNYVLVVKAREWKIAGFVPMLTARHTRVKSNVDWLYTYDRNDIGFKLEYAF